MIEIFTSEMTSAHKQWMELVRKGTISATEYYQLSIAQLELLKKACPDNVAYVSWQAEYYHLDGNLRRSGEQYRSVLEQDPPMELSDQEIRLIKKFCPMLHTTAEECFPLNDVVAIHHPTLPLIGYHLFWADDYDYPDDFEPCDHEEIWIEYDPGEEYVTKVMSFFHSRVIQSEAAAEEARNNGQRAIIRVEWGKHGSLLKGWEEMTEPLTGVPIMDWLQKTYDHVSSGGREAAHPLKRFWPERYTGTFEEYTDFSVPADPLDWLEQKPLMFKTRWANAILQTSCLLYNFHPKMEWPERFYQSERNPY
ncbi:hypothetical protein SAMN05444162_4714 [Paenibacillaceae bacterium GAS479]|nr:hypothetical protein SAMN05444162_4714 [Paenibacillaceae bacterium GAS479]